jgi:ribosomal protein L40E
MAFALAVWATSRAFSAQAHKQIASRLGTTQSKAYLAATRWLNEEVDDVAEVVGLPPRHTWAPARRLDDVLLAFPAAQIADETPVEDDRGVVGRNAGKPVFRLERRLTTRLFRLVIPASFLLGGALSRLGASSSFVVPALAGGAIVMLLLSALVKESICSDPRCGARLDEKAEACARCGGLVAGTIRDPRERLAAEEAWAERHAREAEAEANAQAPTSVTLDTTVAAPQPTGGGGGSAMNSAPLPPG